MKGVILFQVQQQQLCALLLFLLLAAAALAIAAAAPPPPPPIAKPGCSDKCGKISVPYPFGTGKPECYKSKEFQLKCVYCDQFGKNGSDDRNKKCRLRSGGLDIENISVSKGTATTYLFMSSYCYNNSNGRLVRRRINVDLTGSPFTFSSFRNKFTGLGCDTEAAMMDGMGTRFLAGCTSLCNHRVNLKDQNQMPCPCMGVGCCHTLVPKGSKNLNVSLQTFHNFKHVKNFSPCSFAFLADQQWSGFTSIDLMKTSFNVDTYKPPAVLDWVVGEDTCESFDHHSNSSSYACGANTKCYNSYNGPGYLCSCKIGYEGNPYLPQGCQDVDECMYPKRYKCEGRCKNTEGNYTCHCQLGKSGDGKVGCKGVPLSTLGIVGGVCLSLVVTTITLSIECKRRIRVRNFRKNGGTMLKDQDIMIYREKELKKATSNYNAAQLLGQGASGSVYKGVLTDTLVAIKKPNISPNTTRRIKPFRSRDEMKKEFQHEISMICKVNHPNIVKLKGLCLETNVPRLVYEFISNGSLFDHIHNFHSAILNSWKTRLRIAYETALALDYMHSKNGTTLIHRDVKSKNILLDQNYTVKVADFGSSILIPLEQSVINTNVRGTNGYIDPEYWITGNLTVKSDVYSFGVVLMELLTSQMPISNSRSIEQVNFIPYFISLVEEENIRDVLNVRGFDNYEEEMKQVEAVAELAMRCLNTNGNRRPDMNKVAEDLLRLMKLNNKSGEIVDQSNIEEIQSLLGGQNDEQMASTSLGTRYMTTFDFLST